MDDLTYKLSAKNLQFRLPSYDNAVVSTDASVALKLHHRQNLPLEIWIHGEISIVLINRLLKPRGFSDMCNHTSSKNCSGSGNPGIDEKNKSEPNLCSDNGSTTLQVYREVFGVQLASIPDLYC